MTDGARQSYPSEWVTLVDRMGLDGGERAIVTAALGLIAAGRSIRKAAAECARQDPVTPPATRLLLTIPETAATLRTCKATVYNLMDRGELRWVQVAGMRRVAAAEIERFVDAHTEL